MIDIDQKTLQLRQISILKGSRPVIIKILKGDYPYKGRYLLTIGEGIFHLRWFNKWNHIYKEEYKMRKAVDFKIPYDNLTGYRFAFEKTCNKRITLIFKDELEFAFTFICECEEAGNNEKNAMEVMKRLKEKKIFQKNNLKGGKRAQRTISTRDQLFVKEIRSPSKKRGFFG